MIKIRQWQIADGVSGGYVIEDMTIATPVSRNFNYYNHVGLAIQRDSHPVYGGGISNEEALANARLMAAAPDLLNALELIMDRRFALADSYYNPDDVSGIPGNLTALKMAEEAINKAKGKK